MSVIITSKDFVLTSRRFTDNDRKRVILMIVRNECNSLCPKFHALITHKLEVHKTK